VALLTLIVVEMTDTTLVRTWRGTRVMRSPPRCLRSAEDVAEKLLRQNAKEARAGRTVASPGRSPRWCRSRSRHRHGSGQIADEGGKLDLNKVDDGRSGRSTRCSGARARRTPRWRQGVDGARSRRERGAELLRASACEPRGGPMATIDDLS
jgi:hypothetical protein